MQFLANNTQRSKKKKLSRKINLSTYKHNILKKQMSDNVEDDDSIILHKKYKIIEIEKFLPP